MNGRLSRREAWLLTAVLLLVGALALRSAPLALLGGGLLTAAASVTLWQRYCLHGVEYRRLIGERRAFFGEELALSVEIANRKLLPLPWLEADDSIPAGLEVPGGQVTLSTETGRPNLRQLVALRWYERVRLRYRLRCAARGAYRLGPVYVRTGDPFGFVARAMTLPLYDQLIVYPRVLPLSRLGLPAQHPFGDARDRRRLFEDTSRIAGVRPYRTEDSPRHIHWKAAARTGQLQTRVYEPTTHRLLMLYVNLASFEGYWWASLNRDLLELAIVVAASVAAWAVEQGYRVGVTTNGAAIGSIEELSVAPAADPQQLTRILDALARISQMARTPLEQMLARDRARLPFGTTVVVVTAVVPETVREALMAMRASGHAPLVLRIGSPAPHSPSGHADAAGSGGLAVHTIPADVPWMALAAVVPV